MSAISSENNSQPPAYRRILVKLSGAALLGQQPFGIDGHILQRYAQEIDRVVKYGAEVALVIGGGNIYRGVRKASADMTRAMSDYMGMLSTMINAMALQDALEQRNVDTRLLSGITMNAIAEPYIRRRALRHLEKGRVVIFGSGTGSPYFTTDTAAALRALEMDADVLIKGTRVNGVFSADPELDPHAEHYTQIPGEDVIRKELRVMDRTAFTMCAESQLPIIVFDVNIPGSLLRIVQGEAVGTLVHWNSAEHDA